MKPARQKKLRADSKLLALTTEQREEFNRLLMSCSVTLDEAAAWLEERGGGVKMSPQSISKYFHRHVLPERWRYQDEAAAGLLAVDGGKVVSAGHQAIRQLFFSLAVGPCKVDVKELVELYKAMIAGLTAEQNERKLELAERKQAQIDAARAQLENKRTEGGLSEEALKLAEQALGLL